MGKASSNEWKGATMATLDKLNDYYRRLQENSQSGVALDILNEAILNLKHHTKPLPEQISQQEDTAFLFSVAFSEIRDAMDTAMRRNKISFNELDHLLKWEFPAEYARLWGDLYDRINTDVWGKQQEGRLSKNEYETWKQNLQVWKKAWLDILERLNQSGIKN